ncbi:MAG: prenyltransferase/squalene oxidase repeat-containing protein [Acidobacteriota bacterium]
MQRRGSINRAVARATQWLLAHQAEDGSVSPREAGVDAYYKLPYTLGLMGELGAANLLLDWIRDYQMTSTGDFRGTRQRSRLSFHSNWSTYANCWIVLGAHRLGRFDVSLRGIDYILRYQRPCGGFSSMALTGEGEVIEPVCTAWGGLAALSVGRIESACKAGDCLVEMVRRQPDPRRFYFRMTVEGRLITEYPEPERLFYFVAADQEKEIYYNLGIAMILLGRLYQATSESKYLSSCEDLLAFSQRCAADVYASPPSGKLGLGCAILFSISRNPAAKEAASAVADYLVATQGQEGYWRLPDDPLYAQIPGRHELDLLLDVTAEFTSFLAEIAALCR